MKLSHYGFQPLELDRTRTYQQSQTRFAHEKPRGFWVSVDDEFGWDKWCTGEGWNTDGLTHRAEIVLWPEANILTLTTVQDLLDFTEEFGVAGTYGGPAINWQHLAELVDGIIITPYQWECRYGDQTSWYYGWDCASGCIWNLDVLSVVGAEVDA